MSVISTNAPGSKRGPDALGVAPNGGGPQKMCLPAACRSRAAVGTGGARPRRPSTHRGRSGRLPPLASDGENVLGFIVRWKTLARGGHQVAPTLPEDERGTPPVVWQPTGAGRETSRIGEFLRWLERERGLAFADYHDVWRW